MFSKFNRVLLASGLVLTSLVGFGSSAFAEGTYNSGEGGAVGASLPEVGTLVWTPTKTAAAPLALSLYTDVTTEAVMGAVVVKSNDAAGFTVTVASTNQGILLRTGGSAEKAYDKIAYNLFYNSGAVTLTNGSGTAETPTELITACASSTGCSRNVGITTTSQVDGKAHGTYTDTLTFTISNK